jgi:hypothetical protein
MNVVIGVKFPAPLSYQAAPAFNLGARPFAVKTSYEPINGIMG